jgi:prepilin-type N-terminal cleavage/methylation domain-containing protein/prepilin-type processing-associated H-X9-DG protein
LKGEKQMKRKGFTLVELLVVIAIIAMLMGILMPALAMVRKMAMRAVCSANLSGLNKALLVYAQDNKDDYPRAGGRNSTWGRPTQWTAEAEKDAFGETLVPGTTDRYYGGKATISASFYLLIKYADVGVKTFICKGDKGSKPFTLTDFPSVTISELQKVWDFGGNPSSPTVTNQGMPVSQYYSYAYHIPYVTEADTAYQINTTTQPGMPVLADRSPYFAISPDSARLAYQYCIPPATHDEKLEKWGNSVNHNNEGQNVLFFDGSVSFNQVPYCGISADNIYTMDTTTHKEIGSLPYLGSTSATTPLFNAGVKPQSVSDAVLVNEGAKQGSITGN